ncbi:MAG: hypothetical protein V4787_17495 [Pseudomonadota bacterium]
MPSLKPLKSVAHSLAHQFASTLNYWEDDYAIHHLANAARRENAPVVVIDVLRQEVSPREVHAGLVSEIICSLKPSLVGILAKEGFALEVLQSATLTYNFSVPRIVFPQSLPTYDCVCTLVTREGRKYEALLTEGSN